MLVGPRLNILDTSIDGLCLLFLTQGHYIHARRWMAAWREVSATEEANDTLRFHRGGLSSLSACPQRSDMATALPTNRVCVRVRARVRTEAGAHARPPSSLPVSLARGASRTRKVEFMNIDRLASQWVSLGEPQCCAGGAEIDALSLCCRGEEKGGCHCYRNLQPQSHSEGKGRNISFRHFRGARFARRLRIFKCHTQSESAPQSGKIPLVWEGDLLLKNRNCSWHATILTSVSSIWSCSHRSDTFVQHFKLICNEDANSCSKKVREGQTRFTNKGYFSFLHFHLIYFFKCVSGRQLASEPVRSIVCYIKSERWFASELIDR